MTDIVWRLRNRNAPFGYLELVDKAADEIERLRGGTSGEPVAWRVKDYADGWILCHTIEIAEREADGQCLIQPLYAGPIPLTLSRPDRDGAA